MFETETIMVSEVGQVIGFTCSTFDLLHAGHIAMLEEVADQCDVLIVGLQIDPTIDRPEKNKPVESVTERMLKLRAVRVIDEIIVYNTEKDLEDLIHALKFDVRFVGEEYKDKDFTGKQICLDRGVEIIYNRRRHGLSASNLRERILAQTRKR